MRRLPQHGEAAAGGGLGPVLRRCKIEAVQVWLSLGLRLPALWLPLQGVLGRPALALLPKEKALPFPMSRGLRSRSRNEATSRPTARVHGQCLDVVATCSVPARPHWS